VSTDIYELNCPFCDKLYKLPRDKVIKHAGKFIHCRRCGKPFSIPALPQDEPPEELSESAHIAPEPQPEPLATDQTVTAEPAATGPSEPAGHAPPDEPIPLATDALTPGFSEESLEPPALSEYAQPLSSEGETMPIETANETAPQRPEVTSFAQAFPDAPEASSYFSAGMTAQDASPIAPDTSPHEIDDGSAMDHAAPALSALEETGGALPLEEPTVVHPHADEWAAATSEAEEGTPIEYLSHGSPVDEPSTASAVEHGVITLRVQEPQQPTAQPMEWPSDAADVPPIQSPPPSAPAPRTPLPPAHVRPRRGARAVVAPVFGAEAEEPQPRRRGRFAMAPAPIPSAEIEASPLAGDAEITVESIGIASAAVEPPQAHQEHLISEPDKEQDVVSESALESHPIAKADAGAAAQSSLEDSVAVAGAPLPPEVMMAPASPAIQKDLSAIRRFTALLAIMSVVIGLVLVAILLTMLGIIPRK
jgi:hypothetical protein